MSNEIFIVIWSDRHANATVHPFTNQEKAISEARIAAKQYCRYPEDYFENVIGGENNQDWFNKSDWIFHANYSCEGDNVRVVKVEIDKPINK